MQEVQWVRRVYKLDSLRKVHNNPKARRFAKPLATPTASRTLRGISFQFVHFSQKYRRYVGYVKRSRIFIAWSAIALPFSSFRKPPKGRGPRNVPWRDGPR